MERISGISRLDLRRIFRRRAECHRTAVLALVSHESLTRLNALKQVIAFSVNVAATIFFLFSGKVRWSATVVMAIGPLIGGGIGGLAADRVRPAVLRGIVVVFAAAISVAYFVR